MIEYYCEVNTLSLFSCFYRELCLCFGAAEYENNSKIHLLARVFEKMALP